MKIVVRLMAVLAFSGWTACANALPVTFNFELDRVFDGVPLQAPIIGTGQVSFDDPGNGSYLLSALTNLSIQFSIFGELFTLADSLTPAGQVLAVISDFGSGRRLQFSNTNGFGSGPYSGSIDFVNANNAHLTFEPPALGPSLDLYFFGVSDIFRDGSYLGTSAIPVAVPLPGTFAILTAGLVLLTLARGERSKPPIDAPR